MERARQSEGQESRAALARKALEVCPDCTDAYLMLAEETAASPAQAAELYSKGLKAGERVLGPRAFEEYVGQFWGILDTRPYMRARQGLAQALWAERRHEEAISHYREMLRLNPGDDQGIRYLLAGGLLDLGRDDELEALLNAYERDRAAEWLYTKALVAYRREGNAEAACFALRLAMEANGHVPPYLLGERDLPAEPPEFIGHGDEDEAAAYAICYASAWSGCSGALEWLAGEAGREH